MHLSPLLRNGLQFLYRHKGAIVIATVLFAFGVTLFGGLHVALADPTDTIPDASTLQNNTNTVIIALILNIITYVLDLVVAALGKLSLLLIEILIIPILNYNSFSSSPIIGLGWSLVRDVMNMFVIVCLIFVAIFTIAGNHRAHWEQQLPQMFIAVVMMNFSRTICGLLIDISQVIMFTFVNALLDIAAGNFAQLLSLPTFGQYSEAAVKDALQNGVSVTEPFKQFIEAFLQVPLYMSIFAILLLLAVAFLYRIVMLWVLVILSPAAFFLSGIKGIFHAAEHSAGEWWSKFTAALMMGPILTFFLWLALAAASSGSVAESENFPMAEGTDTYFSLQALDSSHITSLLLALILLTVGMEIAGEQSSKVGGVAADVINKGMGRRVVGGSLKMPFVAGAAVGGYVGGEALARGNRIFGEALGTKTLTEGVGRAAVRAGRVIGEVPGAGLVGQALTAAGGKVEAYGEHGRKEREAAAEKAYAAKSESQKMADFDLMKRGKGTFSQEEMRAAEKAHLDPAFRKDRVEYLEQENTMLGFSHAESKAMAEKAVDDEFASTLTKQYAKKDTLPEAEQTKLFGEMSKNLHLLKPELAGKFIDSKDFDHTKLKNKTKIFENPDLRAKLEGKIVRTTKDGKSISAMDMARSGELGQDVKASANDVGYFSADGLTIDPAKKASPNPKISGPEIAKEKQVNASVASLMQAPMERDASGKEIKVKMADIGTKTTPPNPAATSAAFYNIAKGQPKEVIVSGIENGSFEMSRVQASDVDISSAPGTPAFDQGMKLTTAIYESSALPPAGPARDTLRTSLNDPRVRTTVAPETLANADVKFLEAGEPIEIVLNNPGLAPTATAAPALTRPEQDRITQMAKADVGTIGHLRTAVSGGAANDVTAAVAKSVGSKRDVETLREQIRKETNTAKRAQMKDGLETARLAVQAERARAGNTRKQNERFDELDNEIDVAISMV